MKFTQHQKSLLAVAICTIIWSAAAPIFKWSMQTTPPYTLLFFRFLIATLIMLPIAWKRIGIKFEDFYKIFLLAITGITLNIGLFYLGLSLSESINAPIISSTMPIFLIIGSIFFLHEIPKPKVIFGTIVSLIGVLIIIFRPIDHLSLVGLVLGNIYFILSVLALTSYIILLKRFKPRYSSSTLIFWIFLIATITFFPPFILELSSKHLPLQLNFQSSFGILYGAIFSSIVGQIFYNYSVKRLNSGELGLFTYLGPAITALIAIPLLHEQITFEYLLGSIFVFLGLFIAEVKLRYHPFHH
ncbi:MAG TPA: DMT family transporter, partial [Candidatus Saccharimonadales bacterium]|nr:DMT family transporter [Candidatus Saccharimonadales bacterium]